MLRNTLIAVLLLVIPATIGAQSLDRYPPGTPVPVPRGQNESGTLPVPRHSVGSVAVGDRAPDFELERATGGRQRLSELRGGWTALWFGARLADLPDACAIAKELEKDEVTFVVVAAERAGRLRGWIEKNPTTAMLLSDAACDIASEYGAFDAARGQPTCGLVVLDEKGIVRVAVVGHALPPGEAARMVQIAKTSL